MKEENPYYRRLSDKQKICFKVFLEGALNAETDAERSLFLNNPFLRRHNRDLYYALQVGYDAHIKSKK